MTNIEREQATYKAQGEYARKHPEWMTLALAAINRWGRVEATLPHAIAEALQDAYERGTRGEYPELEHKTSIIIRRQRPAPAPTIIRRRR